MRPRAVTGAWAARRGGVRAALGAAAARQRGPRRRGRRGPAAWAAPAPAAHVPALCDALGIARRLDLGPGAVALTFDDGPHPHGTPAVLEALAAAGARRRSSSSASSCARTRRSPREIVAAGHRLAVHGDRHRCTSLRTPRALRADLDRCAALVEELTGDVRRRATARRSGSSHRVALARRGGAAGRRCCGRRGGATGAPRATPDSIAARGDARRSRAGDVVLLHDADHYSAAGSWRARPRALPRILDALAARGLRAVAVVAVTGGSTAARTSGWPRPSRCWAGRRRCP